MCKNRNELFINRINKFSQALNRSYDYSISLRKCSQIQLNYNARYIYIPIYTGEYHSRLQYTFVCAVENVYC